MSSGPTASNPPGGGAATGGGGTGKRRKNAGNGRAAKGAAAANNQTNSQDANLAAVNQNESSNGAPGGLGQKLNHDNKMGGPGGDRGYDPMNHPGGIPGHPGGIPGPPGMGMSLGGPPGMPPGQHQLPPNHAYYMAAAVAAEQAKHMRYPGHPGGHPVHPGHVRAPGVAMPGSPVGAGASNGQRFMGPTPTLNQLLLQSPQRGAPGGYGPPGSESPYGTHPHQGGPPPSHWPPPHHQPPISSANSPGPSPGSGGKPQYGHQVQAPMFRPPVLPNPSSSSDPSSNNPSNAPPSPKRPPSNGPPPGSPYPPRSMPGYPPGGSPGPTPGTPPRGMYHPGHPLAGHHLGLPPGHPGHPGSQPPPHSPSGPHGPPRDSSSGPATPHRATPPHNSTQHPPSTPSQNPASSNPYGMDNQHRGHEESSNDGAPQRGAPSPASAPGSRSMSPNFAGMQNHGTPPEGYPGGPPANSYPGGPPQNKMSPSPQGPPQQYPAMGYPPQGFSARPGYGPPPGGAGYAGYPPRHYPPQGGYPQPGQPMSPYHQQGAGAPAPHGHPHHPSHGTHPHHPAGMMPPPSQYGYPPPRPGPPPNVTAGGPGGPPNTSPGSPRHPGHPAYLRQHLQQKIYGYSSPMTPPMQEGGHSRGSPSPAPDPSMSPRSNGPPQSQGPPEHKSSSQPPSSFDEGSQASNASACSSTADDSGSNSQMASNNQSSQHRLQPGAPTPSPRSMSSFPEDYDGGANSRSPAPSPHPPPGPPQVWSQHAQSFPPNQTGFNNQASQPGAGGPPTAQPNATPNATGTTTPGSESKPTTKGANSIMKLYDLGPEPDRKEFLDRLIRFNEEKGTAITSCPTISKQPLDLYKLYMSVRDRGGFVDVTRQKTWKDVAGIMNVGASSSAAYTLRKQYIKHVLPYECRFDRGNIDPQPIIDSLESPAARKKKNATAAAAAAASGAAAPAGNAVASPQEPNANSNHGASSMPGQGPPTASPTPQQPPQQLYPGHPDYQQQQPQTQGQPQQAPGLPPSPLVPPVPGQPQTPGANQQPQYPPGQGYPEGRPPSGYPGPHPGPPGPHGAPHPHPGATPYPPPPGHPGHHPGMDPQSPYPGYPGYPSRGPPQGYPHTRSPHSNGPIPGDYGQGQGQPPPQYPSAPPPGPNAAGPHQPSSQATPPPPTATQSPFPEKPPTPQTQQVPPSQPVGPPQSPAMIQSRSQSPAVGSPRPHGPHTPGPPSLGADSRAQSPHIKQEGPPTPQGSAPTSQGQSMHTSRAQTSSPAPGSPMPSTQPGAPGQITPHHLQQPQHFPGYPPHPMPAPPGHMQGPRPPMHQYPPQSGHPGMPPHPGHHPSAVMPSNASQTPPDGPPPNRVTPYDSSSPHQKPFPQGGPPGHNGQHMRPYPPGPPGPPNMQAPPRPDFFNKRHPDFLKDQPPFSAAQLYERGPPGMPGYPPSRQNASPGPGGWPPRGPQFDGPQSRWAGQPNSDWLSSPNAAKVGPQGFNSSPLSRMAGPQSYLQPKMAPPSIAQQMTPRKELMLPPDCIEAVTPVPHKRRRLFAKDVAPVEAWRLMMSLKSGLLAESTWALDVISILMYDDNSILYFGLQHLPGFLEVILEHYRKCLSEMFSITDDLELGYDYAKIKIEPEDEEDKPWFLLSRDVKKKEAQSKPPVTRLPNLTKEDSFAILDSVFAKRNSVTSDGKAIVVKERALPEGLEKLIENDFATDVPDAWEDFNGGYDHWQMGAGEITSHIQTHFESEKQNVRFVRLMRTGKDDGERKAGADSFDWAFELDKHLREKEKKEVESEIESVLMNGEVSENILEGRKRRREQDMDDEAYTRDEPSLCTLTDQQESLGKRTVCLSTIIRNLSFVPGNDTELAKHPGVLLIIGRMLLLNHTHNMRKPRVKHSKESVKQAAEAAAKSYPQILESQTTPNDGMDQCCSLTAESEWWWEYLQVLRDNSLVTLANISTALDLGQYSEEISLPILDGLLHWAVCESALARDPLPGSSVNSTLSLQRLSVEALCKLSVIENNVDLLLATPPWSRVERLISQLSRWLARGEDQVLREFSVVLISNLVLADFYVARAVAQAGNCVSHLISFVEQAEQSALQVANNQGINALRDNPELMGTTLDMVRRAAATLKHLSRVPDNRQLFVQQQQRLLTLVMSQILDQGVAANIADVLYQVSLCDVPPKAAFAATVTKETKDDEKKEKDSKANEDGDKEGEQTETEEGEGQEDSDCTENAEKESTKEDGERTAKENGTQDDSDCEKTPEENDSEEKKKRGEEKLNNDNEERQKEDGEEVEKKMDGNAQEKMDVDEIKPIKEKPSNKRMKLICDKKKKMSSEDFNDDDEDMADDNDEDTEVDGERQNNLKNNSIRGGQMCTSANSSPNAKPMKDETTKESMQAATAAVA